MKTDQLTFTRFIAAISVVFYHSRLDVFPVKQGVLHDYFANSSTFVTYFFILSGFVMIIAYHDRKVDLKKFYVNRIARIYPLYILALAIIALPKLRHLGVGSFLLQVTMLQSWVPAHAQDFNVPAWSLSTELFFYLVFPFILKYFYQKVSLPVVAIAIIAIVIANSYIVDSLTDYFYPVKSRESELFHDAFPLFRLYQFMLGNLTGLIFVKVYDDAKRNIDWVVALLFATIFTCISYHQFKSVRLSAELLFSITIFGLALNTGYISKLLSKKPFVKLGEISYGVYILQMSIGAIWYFAIHFGLMPKRVDNFYYYLISLLIVSYFAFKYVEIPARSYLRKKLVGSPKKVGSPVLSH
jgi:peptidoglycan/LPS O-acetylase OafA/YrhL